MTRPLDDYNQHRVNARNTLISGITSVSAMCLALGGIAYQLWKPQSHELQKILVPVGLLSAVSAVASSKVYDDTNYIIQDYRDISDQQRTNRVYQENAPIVRLQTDEKLKPFNWTTFKYKYDKYPHIAVVGRSGEGKSQLAEYICGILGGTTVAIDPHYEVGNYTTAAMVINSRDALDASPLNIIKEGKVPSFRQIVNGEVSSTIPEFIASVYLEMDWRLRQDLEGHFNAREEDEVNLIWDEYNSYSGRSGKVFERLLRESRKARLRNIFILQNADVQSMGFEGNGGVRSNIVFIRLGEMAVTYAESKIEATLRGTEDSEYWVQVLKAFKKDLIPCLVGDEYAIIPYIIK